MQEILKHLKTFINGYRAFETTGHTPEEAYLAMRRLYVLTNGWFNDAVHKLIALQHHKKNYEAKSSIFSQFSDTELKTAVNGLRQNGFYVFNQTLPLPIVDALYEHSLTTPALHQTAAGCAKEVGTPFDPSNIVATNYRIPERFIINNETVQKLLADPVVVRVAQEYLGSEIVFVNSQMWWTTPKDCDQPASGMAQMFHFDMDRIKFMKFFVYLTDVNTNSGPHCYISGSCARKPKATLQDRRFSDAELHEHFPADSFAEINGPRGTLLAVDTRGFHKAKMPTDGNRLILQIEIADSLFGQNYGHPELVLKTAELKELARMHPRMLSNYVITEASQETQPAKELMPMMR